MLFSGSPNTTVEERYFGIRYKLSYSLISYTEADMLHSISLYTLVCDKTGNMKRLTLTCQNEQNPQTRNVKFQQASNTAGDLVFGL